MTISPDMSLGQLARLMGHGVQPLEAERMRDALCETDYTDNVQIPQDEWDDMVESSSLD